MARSTRTRTRRPAQAEATEGTPTDATGEEGTEMAEATATAPSLQEVSLDDIPASSTRTGKASKVIDEFVASGMSAAKVDNASKGFNIALRRYIKAQGEAGNALPVEVVTRKNGEGVTHYLKRT